MIDQRYFSVKCKRCKGHFIAHPGKQCPGCKVFRNKDTCTHQWTEWLRVGPSALGIQCRNCGVVIAMPPEPEWYNHEKELIHADHD